MGDKNKSPKGGSDGGLVDVLKPIAIRIQNGSQGDNKGSQSSSKPTKGKG